MIKITVWRKKNLFKKEEYYFTYGYCDNDECGQMEILKAKIQFNNGNTFVKTEDIDKI